MPNKKLTDVDQFQLIYRQWESSYRLLNRPPGKVYPSLLKLGGHAVVFLGASLLSGSQTGVAMVAVSALPTFMKGRGLSDVFAIWFVFVVSFITFELTLFIAGIMTEGEEENKIWYKVEMIASLLVVIATALHLAIPDYINTQIVNIVLALGGPVIAFVSGKAIGTLLKEVTTVNGNMSRDYDISLQEAWSKTRQWKAYAAGKPVPALFEKETRAKKVKQVEKVVLAKKTSKVTASNAEAIRGWLNGDLVGDWLPIREVVSGVNEGGTRFNSVQAALPAIDHLVTQGILERNGMTIRTSAKP